MHAFYVLVYYVSCTSWKASVPLPLLLCRAFGRPFEPAPHFDNGNAGQCSPDCCLWSWSGLPTALHLVLCGCSGHRRQVPLSKLQYSAGCWYACATVTVVLCLHVRLCCIALYSSLIQLFSRDLCMPCHASISADAMVLHSPTKSLCHCLWTLETSVLCSGGFDHNGVLWVLACV